MQKTKWFSEKALQMSKKRKDMKGKGEKERYTHVNAELQRIASTLKGVICDHGPEGSLVFCRELTPMVCVMKW